MRVTARLLRPWNNCAAAEARRSSSALVADGTSTKSVPSRFFWSTPRVSSLSRESACGDSAPAAGAGVRAMVTRGVPPLASPERGASRADARVTFASAADLRRLFVSALSASCSSPTAVRMPSSSCASCCIVRSCCVRASRCFCAASATSFSRGLSAGGSGNTLAGRRICMDVRSWRSTRVSVPRALDSINPISRRYRVSLLLSKVASGTMVSAITLSATRVRASRNSCVPASAWASRPNVSLMPWANRSAVSRSGCDSSQLSKRSRSTPSGRRSAKSSPSMYCLARCSKSARGRPDERRRARSVAKAESSSASKITPPFDDAELLSFSLGPRKFTNRKISLAILPPYTMSRSRCRIAL